MVQETQLTNKQGIDIVVDLRSQDNNGKESKGREEDRDRETTSGEEETFQGQSIEGKSTGMGVSNKNRKDRKSKKIRVFNVSIVLECQRVGDAGEETQG
ncbi:hypothetical protein Q3G72_015771 [Acer saccharum]|nr:hypothetical protein Q3G72_015771 [Acer saccharum]